MAEISIITFNRGITKDTIFSVPSYLEHWGIYIEYLNDNSSQILYHVDKASITNNNSLYLHKTWTWLNDQDKKVDYLVLVGYSSKLNHEEMSNICSKLTENRTFNTLTNNCQKWVESVLVELANTGNISKLCLEELKNNNEIVPLLGWNLRT
jgi:hypothetical protein